MGLSESKTPIIQLIEKHSSSHHKEFRFNTDRDTLPAGVIKYIHNKGWSVMEGYCVNDMHPPSFSHLITFTPADHHDKSSRTCESHAAKAIR